ncbi:hypothetical protein KC19_VG141400 [Ceratodon purpureus]|uniref:Uncharacterized protein n=1 Tax=Ceratodon purpureus TaxID=3225 RepID=A0A8T0HR40_CERPU|nr:hypothetical protein KC19_VG141400 [Ceratodon purpureus]
MGSCIHFPIPWSRKFQQGNQVKGAYHVVKRVIFRFQVRNVLARDTKRDPSFEVLTQVPVLDLKEEADNFVGEFILISSMDQILGGKAQVPIPAYDKLVEFLSKHSTRRSRLHKGDAKPHPYVDLILVDMPEKLLVSGISNSVGSISLWNQDSKLWFNPIFEFADHYLEDDGAISYFILSE